MTKVLNEIMLLETGGEIRVGDGAPGVNFTGIRLWKTKAGYEFQSFESDVPVMGIVGGVLQRADGVPMAWQDEIPTVTTIHASGGWTDDAAVVRLTTATDSVVIGGAVALAKTTIYSPNDYDGSFLTVGSRIDAGYYRLTLRGVINSGYMQYAFDQIDGTTTYSNVLAFNRGMVGIRTPDPSAALDVVSNHASQPIAEFRQSHASNVAYVIVDSPTDSDTQPAFVRLSRAGATKWDFGLGYGHTLDGFHISTTNLGAGVTGSKLCVTSAGNVGIGTPAPGAKLELYRLNSAGTETTLRLTNYDGSARYADIYYSSVDYTLNLYNHNSYLNSGIKFFTASSSTVAKVSILDSGNVSITGKLALAGATTTSSETIVMPATFWIASNNGALRHVIGENVLSGLLTLDIGDNTPGRWNYIKFWTNGSAAIIIDNAGQVGVGRTPAETLDVGGNIRTIAAVPRIKLRADGQAADSKIWRTVVDGLILKNDVINDAETSAQSWSEITRSGATISKVVFPNGDTVVGADQWIGTGGRLQIYSNNTLKAALGIFASQGTAREGIQFWHTGSDGYYGVTNTLLIAGEYLGAGAYRPVGIATGNATRFLITTSGNVLIGTTSSTGGKLEVLSTTEQLRLSYDNTYKTSFTVNASGSLAIDAGTGSSGNITVRPYGKFFHPYVQYETNLGAINRKWLTLHAAELWVETLVAQDAMATFGGRILVGPTTTLIADLAAAATTIDVKYNNLSSGDRVYMEAGGQLEFISIDSAATTITGGYRYTVTRNLDGSGANDWNAGDAMFNTGQTGNGFIDLYSLRGVKAGSEYGPAIVGNVRNSSTYNDWSPRWAIGNLNGLFDYGATTYGAAFGNYAATWLGIDATNGIRIMNATTAVGKWDTSGNFTVGVVSASHANVYITAAGVFQVRTNTDVKIQLSGDGSGYVAGGNVSWNAAGVVTITGSIGGYVASGGAAADVNANSTTIDGGKITATSSITAGIGNNVGVLSGADATYRIWAGHATAASAPFSVTKAGAIYSTSGTIGGWSIGATSLTDTAGTVGISSAVTAGDDIRFWAGNVTPASAPFRVTEAGVLVAQNASIIGTLQTGNVDVSTILLSGDTVTYYDSTGNNIKVQAQVPSAGEINEVHIFKPGSSAIAHWALEYDTGSNTYIKMHAQFWQSFVCLGIGVTPASSTYGLYVGAAIKTDAYFTSTVTTGTAPLVVSSTTAVTNLNADLLDGNHASAFETAGTMTSHLSAYAHGNIANGQTAYGWGNHASAGYALASTLSSHTSDILNPHSVTKSQLSLGNVENTALSTWAGSGYIITVGTITSGTWTGSIIGGNYGGTGLNLGSTGSGFLYNGGGSLSAVNTVGVGNGGTGAGDAGTARTNLGLGGGVTGSYDFASTSLVSIVNGVIQSVA